jgi:hypothetical protein
MKPKVVVVMPAYNAGRTLRMTYEKLLGGVWSIESGPNISVRLTKSRLRRRQAE